MHTDLNLMACLEYAVKSLKVGWSVEEGGGVIGSYLCLKHTQFVVAAPAGAQGASQLSPGNKMVVMCLRHSEELPLVAGVLDHPSQASSV